jgi:hypothetical protein
VTAAQCDAFMAERGGSLAGYIAFYERFGRDADYAARLYEADRDLRARIAAGAK